MQTLATFMPDGEERGAEALNTLREAYLSVFVNNNADKNQMEMVLVDIMKVSGYHTVAAADASDGTLRELNGSRRVGGYIMQMLNYPRKKLDALERAIEAESYVDALNGE